MTLYAVMPAGGGGLAAAERTGPVTDPARLGTLVAGALVRSAARSALFTRPQFLTARTLTACACPGGYRRDPLPKDTDPP